MRDFFVCACCAQRVPQVACAKYVGNRQVCLNCQAGGRAGVCQLPRAGAARY